MNCGNLLGGLYVVQYRLPLITLTGSRLPWSANDVSYFAFSQLGFNDLGAFHYERGDLNTSLKSYVRSREYCTNSKQILEMCLNVIQVALELNNVALVNQVANPFLLHNSMPSNSNSLVWLFTSTSDICLSVSSPEVKHTRTPRCFDGCQPLKKSYENFTLDVKPLLC